MSLNAFLRNPRGPFNRRVGWMLVLGLTLSGMGRAAGQAAERQPVPVDVYAPPITGGPWLNTPNGKAIDLEDRKGKVTLVHFWTFG